MTSRRAETVPTAFAVPFSAETEKIDFARQHPERDGVYKRPYSSCPVSMHVATKYFITMTIQGQRHRSPSRMEAQTGPQAGGRQTRPCASQLLDVLATLCRLPVLHGPACTWLSVTEFKCFYPLYVGYTTLAPFFKTMNTQVRHVRFH